MKFGIFYEHQLPKPWSEDDEFNLLQEALEQVVLADRLGFDYAWEVEHHFLAAGDFAVGTRGRRREMHHVAVEVEIVDLEVAIAAIGPTTAQALIDQGIGVDVQPETYTTAALVEALAHYFREEA